VQDSEEEENAMPRAGKSKTRSLPIQWEELTAFDFPKAVEQAEGVCVLPIGSIEFHGLHLPMGTDMMIVSEIAARAAQREYAVVFPPYYLGQVHDTKHRPGCVAIAPELLMPVLQEICSEISRNGFKKILIVNGHGGNTNWLNFFCESRLAKGLDYVVYQALETWYPSAAVAPQIAALFKTGHGGHADELEASYIMAMRPELVQLEHAGKENGGSQGRMRHLEKDFLTAVSWYADFPNAYMGDARPATRKLGEVALAWSRDQLARMIREVKTDKVAPRLQKEFFARVEAGKGEPTQERRS
jgi:creatinine amidohydrolase